MNKTSLVVAIIMVVALATGASSVFAATRDNSDRQIRNTDQRTNINDRLEERRDRIEVRVKRTQERVCMRIERLNNRHGIVFPLPSFCHGGNGGGNNGDDEPTLTFTASPTSITLGASSTLTWDSTNADSCSATNGWSGSKSVDGSENVSPTATTTYTLTCENDEGNVVKSVVVGVRSVNQSSPSVDLTAASSTIMQGSSTLLSWSSTNASSCVASNGWSGTKTASGTQSVTPTATTTYTLECGNGTASSSDSVTVNVSATGTPTPLPTVDLSADPLNVTSGGTSTLTWTSTNASTCLASNGNGWSGTKATSGTQIVTVNATTTYVLACTNAHGTATDTVEVVAIPAPVVTHGKVVLSEVLAQPVVSQGSTSTTANEWVEVYNGSSTAVDLFEWKIKDAATATDTIATTTLMLPSGGYLIITNSTTTADFWSFPLGTLVVYLKGPIGSGLNDGGDALYLYDASGAVVDAMSYGTNASVFPTLATPDPLAGQSAARVPVTTDTNTGADWVVLATPTPGA